MALTDLKYDIILNEKAGTIQRMGEEAVSSLIHEKLGERVNSVTLTSGKDIGTSLQKLLKKKPQAVLLGGGDGTIGLCGKACVEYDIPFGIIPLGTMNLLARDLGIPVDLAECLESYQTSRNIRIDIGAVNDHIFFCNTIVGIIPEASVEREKNRETPSVLSWATLTQTTLNNLNNDHLEKFEISMRGKSHPMKAKSFIVSNNAYIKTPKSPEERLSRETLQAGKLSVYMAYPKTFFQSLKLLFKLLIGGWPKDQAIKHFETGSLVMKSAQKEVLVSIDGEPMKMRAPLNFTINPGRAHILIPAESLLA